jgi:hypothetical protein
MKIPLPLEAVMGMVGSMPYLPLVKNAIVIKPIMNFVCIGGGISKDLKGATHHVKLAAEINYGLCLENGEGATRNLMGAGHYSKLSADQGIAVAQLNYGVCLKKRDSTSNRVEEHE